MTRADRHVGQGERWVIDDVAGIAGEVQLQALGKLKILWSDMLMDVSGGPMRLFLPRFPKVPGVGAANALTLNQWSMLGPPGTSRQSPTTLGYQTLFVERA